MTITTTRPEIRVEAVNNGTKSSPTLSASPRSAVCWWHPAPKVWLPSSLVTTGLLLVGELRDSFPGATLQATEDDRVVGRVVGLIEDPSSIADLPLDIRGTPFQQKVWAALQAIPAGVTELLRIWPTVSAIRTPSARWRALAPPTSSRWQFRATGCSGPTVPYPGYRWGVDRKRALIVREAFVIQMTA